MTKSNRQERREQARTERTFADMQHYVDLHERSAPSMSAHLELVLQKALDQGRSHAVRACQAIGLPAPLTETLASQSEDANGPKETE